MKNTHGQEAYSVRTPPRKTPAVPPAGAAAPYSASALVSSFGEEPKVMNSSVSAAGAMSADPAPWTARPASSTRTLPANPAISEPAARTTQPSAEDAAGAEQVREPAAEEQEAAERDDVGVEDPAEPLRGEAEVVLHLRQRDADDGGVHDDHELGRGDDAESKPAAAASGFRGGRRSRHDVPFCGDGPAVARLWHHGHGAGLPTAVSPLSPSACRRRDVPPVVSSSRGR